jgi:hypothetical protein
MKNKLLIVLSVIILIILLFESCQIPFYFNSYNSIDENSLSPNVLSKFIYQDSHVGLVETTMDINRYNVENWQSSSFYRNHKIKCSNQEYSSWDPIAIAYIDYQNIIIVTGPTSLNSGIRFFLLPNFSFVWVFETKSFIPHDEYCFWGNINKCTLYGDTLFLKFADNTYGYKSLK